MEAATSTSTSQSISQQDQQQPSFRDLFLFTAWPDYWLLGAGLVGALLAGAFMTSMSILLGRIFAVITQFGSGHLTGAETAAQVSSWCVLLAVVGGAGFLVNFAFMFSWVAFSELQARNIRKRMFRGLLEKDMQWFDTQQDGVASLLIRIQTQTREVQIASSVALGSLSARLATSIANLIIALVTAWKLTLVLLASIPVSVVILHLLARPIQPAIQSQKKELSRASKYAFSAISAIDLVKVFNGIDHETWQYMAAIRMSMQKYLIQARANAYQIGYVKFWLESLFVVGFYYGAVLVDQGLSPGSVLTTFYAALAALQAIEAFVPTYLVLAKGISAAQALRSVSHNVEGGRTVYPMVGGYVPSKCVGDIEMRNITFTYPSNPSKMVLEKSSFHFQAGELCFIIGRSGSGKSTVGNLLLKFYEPLSGEILIDGHAIRTLDIDWLRHNITLIQQTSVLFNDTFFMNIAFGHNSPTRVSTEEVKAACETALLQSTITSLPCGMNTNVGAGGHNLSGGQKQRVALARAKLRDPPVLILDEVTSGLDPVNRELIMEAIRTWRRGKTTVIITHEVAQIKERDFVYVMDNGRVVQEGLYSDLQQQHDGLLAQLVTAATASGSRSERSTEGFVARQSKSSVVNFSRPLSDASQNDPLVPGSPSPGEALRGVPSSSHDVFMMARRDSQLRLLGDQRSRHIDASGALNALAAAAEDSPRRGLSRMVTSLSRHFTSTRAPAPSQSPTWSSSDQPLTPISPIKAGSIFRLQTLGYTVQTHRQGSRSSRFKHQPRSSLSGTGPRRKDERSARQDEKRPSDSEETETLSLVSIYKTVWPCLGFKERMFILVGSFSSLVVAGSVPAFSIVFANLLAALYKKENRLESGQKWALILLGIAGSGAIATFLSHYLLEWAGQAWVNELRKQAFNRVLRQPKTWFENPKHSPSRINECLDRNAEEMRNLVGRFAPLLLVVVVMIVASVSWALAISWKLTLVSLASGPFLIAATQGYSAVSNKWELRCNKAAEETNAIVVETFTNIRVIRALTLEGFFGRKHQKSAQNTFELGIKKAAFTAALYACWQSVFWFMMALIFWYATVLLAVNQEITVQSILQVVNLLVLGLSTASNILNSVPAISAAQTTASLLLYYARLPLNSSHETKGTKTLARPLPIRFNNLSFAYPSKRNQLVLRNITLTFEAGVSTAIVGSSGCGKSTIASIILGLHTPNTSSNSFSRNSSIHPLLFSSVPFQQVDISKLRTQIGYVPQAPFLFPTSIAGNIAYGLLEDSPLRSPANIEQAAREAGIHDFIHSLPDGYETIVGDGGQALSGGQAQRVCIARALARRPKILVLDEPTSALDAESAEGVRRTIQNLLNPEHHRLRKSVDNMQSRERLCVIMVTHSQEMMKMADRIVMIDHGRVVETGTYRELWEKKGPFAELVSGGVWMGGGKNGDIATTTPQKPPGYYKYGASHSRDLPLRSGKGGEEVRPRWIGVRDVDWNGESGPSTGVLSPVASPFSRPARRRERKADGDV
ncbi:P-loop containing nucleoside triphosphate hydrolase protein [Xylaria bambusicola]|uniref:P-loop containing nucleoside triphosphate hydrolase protein n=1 Tax=Xylaria bambusicola TaxID=326684 RepID=UPI002008BAA9|nr:P-loop containing nucleoside triphosphate hydrolase protein [Xylaria bambusicola]KAI0506658.1 P-loop containing nucleoside triphosphate hydrolase protein [Xylaria bambusicola]